MIEVGAKAPDFSLPDADGRLHRLSDFAGRWLVLYIYPRDDSPACSAEAQDFLELHAEILKRGALVVGVSPDTVAAHRRFRDKYRLPFLLLSDPEKALIAAYGAWGEKKMYGRSFPGTLRSTFLIDREGFIRRVFPVLRVRGHARELLKTLEEEAGS
jgi:peroxiredoxin Q/BCP